MVGGQPDSRDLVCRRRSGPDQFDRRRGGLSGDAKAAGKAGHFGRNACGLGPRRAGRGKAIGGKVSAARTAGDGPVGRRVLRPRHGGRVRRRKGRPTRSVRRLSPRRPLSRRSRSPRIPQGAAAGGAFLPGQVSCLGRPIRRRAAAVAGGLENQSPAKIRNPSFARHRLRRGRQARPRQGPGGNRSVVGRCGTDAGGPRRGVALAARCQFGLDQLAACLATLDKIPRKAETYAQAIVLHGRVLRREAQQIANRAGATADQRRAARRKYAAAVEAFRLAQSRDTVSNVAARQAMYLTGLCLLDLGDDRAALDQWDRTSRLFAEQPEGLAAAIEQADLLRRLKRNDEALAAYRRALAAVRDVEAFHNPWVSLEELRRRALAAYRADVDEKDFESALWLARAAFAAAADDGLGVDGGGVFALGRNGVDRGGVCVAGQGRIAAAARAGPMAAGGSRLRAWPNWRSPSASIPTGSGTARSRISRDKTTATRRACSAST